MAQSMVWVLLALLVVAAAGIFMALSGRAKAAKKKQEKDRRDRSQKREKANAGRRVRKLSENGPVGPVSAAGRAASLAPKTPQLNALHEKLALASASSDARLGQAAGAAFYSALFDEEDGLGLMDPAPAAAATAARDAFKASPAAVGAGEPAAEQKAEPAEAALASAHSSEEPGAPASESVEIREPSLAESTAGGELAPKIEEKPIAADAEDWGGWVVDAVAEPLAAAAENAPHAAETAEEATREALAASSSFPEARAEQRKELAETGEILEPAFAQVGVAVHADWAFGETMGTPLALRDALGAQASQAETAEAKADSGLEAPVAPAAEQAAAESEALAWAPAREEKQEPDVKEVAKGASEPLGLEATAASAEAAESSAALGAAGAPMAAGAAEEQKTQGGELDAAGPAVAQLENHAEPQHAAPGAVEALAPSDEKEALAAEPLLEAAQTTGEPESAPVAAEAVVGEPKAQSEQESHAATIERPEAERAPAWDEEFLAALSQPSAAETEAMASAERAPVAESLAEGSAPQAENQAAADAPIPTEALGEIAAAAASPTAQAEAPVEERAAAPRSLKDVQELRRQGRENGPLAEELQDGADSLRELAARRQNGGDWWQESQAGTPPGWAEEEELPKAPWTVLVVDDSGVARAKVSRSLRQMGCEVQEAKDGQDAWDKMASWKPDLLVTDVEMPRMDGIALSNRVKSDLRLASIPIIIMSAHLANLWEKIADAQINGVLPKPFDDDLLRDQAKLLLAEKRG